jgi:alpha-tubulin suppressor-like RCC1 family protein
LATSFGRRVLNPIAGLSVALTLAMAIAAGACSSSSDGLNAAGGDDAADASSSGGGPGGLDSGSFHAIDASYPSPDGGNFTGLQCDGSPCALAISAGGGHACALLDDHTVRCWGQNVFGELGSGSLDSGSVSPALTPTPTLVPGLTAVSQIATGGYGGGLGVSCALAGGAPSLPEGGAVCWGSNAGGILGIGAPGDASAKAPALSIEPLPLALDSVQQLALGGFFGCALVADGGVACWGDNSEGELGRDLDGASFDPTPTAVPLPGPAMAVTTGKNHACALLADQSVMCWGAGDHGAIGTVADGGVTTPRRVPGLAATSLAAGEVSTCALTVAGSVACWGGNQGGQLGRGDAMAAMIDPSPALVALPSTSRAVQIVSAVGSTCALLQERTVWCWGDNAYGELGTGSSVPGFSATPAAAQGLTNIVQIASGPGGWTVCALLQDGSVRCWGANYADQLGVDTSGDAGPDESPHPVPLRVVF